MSSQGNIFHEIYVKYEQDVYRFAYWLSGNPDDACDITSETFVRVWTAPNAPRTDSVKAYLFAIARHLVQKQWRRTSREKRFPDGLQGLIPPPDEAASQREELRLTMAAMQLLPEIDRTVLLLRAESELSYEDISAVTGLSVSAAKVKVFRARAKLVALLKPESGEDK